MNSDLIRKFRAPAIVTLQDEITQRQYLSPLVPLGDVLNAISGRFSIKLHRLHAAAVATGLKLEQAVGRLKQVEIHQLARQIRRQHRREAASV